MKKYSLSTKINADSEKVWKVLWSDETYRQWTKPFHECSYAVSDWEEGGKILFLTGQGDGMYSVIDKKIPCKFMSFKHLGSIKNGVELPVDEGPDSWSGTFENYSLKEADGVTELTVETDVLEDFTDFFDEKFPVAFEKVKRLAEA